VSKAAAPAPATPSAPSIDLSQLTLHPRPEPSPEVMAAITTAAQLVWPRPAEPDEPNPSHDTWRFSGRWWAQPINVRRSRPWARP
jgi:hypothetical protein